MYTDLSIVVRKSQMKFVWRQNNVVHSLLCLWPYGNSLIVCFHSEFYQCHTQNRSQWVSGQVDLRMCKIILMVRQKYFYL